MKRLFRWALFLFVIFVILVVAGLLVLDRMAREAIQSSIRAQTGLEAKIEKVTVGLTTPTFTIEGLTLYNSAEFGGSPMLKMPELHLEYDATAIRSRDLHLKLVRLNISEIEVIKDKQGRLNFQVLQKKTGENGLSSSEVKSRLGGFTFTGVDTLNLTLGKLRISSLARPNQGQEIAFGIQNQIFHNIKSEADLSGVGLLLAARNALASPSKSGRETEKLLEELTGKR